MHNKLTFSVITRTKTASTAEFDSISARLSSRSADPAAFIDEAISLLLHVNEFYLPRVATRDFSISTVNELLYGDTLSWLSLIIIFIIDPSVQSFKKN